ncbi:unnamed protein product [Diplocarpon coronariae]
MVIWAATAGKTLRQSGWWIKASARTKEPLLLAQPCVLRKLQLLTLVAIQEAGKIRCVGLNYTDHAAEVRLALPTHLEIFLKPDICVHSPVLPLTLPKITSWECDAEVELAVVISKMCRDVTPARATEFVLGYMTANDMTARKIQGKGSQWGYSKGFDGFCPMRPCLVARKAIPDPSLLLQKTTLDGWLAQSVRLPYLTGKMVSGWHRRHSMLTVNQGTTLTVVFTGTPAGIEHSYSPPLYLKEGSDLKMWISHGLGTLVNKVEQVK